MASPVGPKREGFVVWMEGLPGSGKTTISHALEARLHELGWDTEVLDGDEVRRTLSPELTFSRKDRETHARRVSYIARVLARHGVAVVVAMITPYETSRQAARSTVGARFEEVWLRCPIEVCRRRDPKGIYRQSGEGAVAHLTGVDDPFEEPLAPELTVDTATGSVEESTRRILKHLVTSGILTASSG
jgi:adenylyl-sulfate kinase